MSWNKFLSGFNEIPHALIRGGRISYNLYSYDHTDIGSNEAPFRNIYADNFSNAFGTFAVNTISTTPPLTASIQNGIASLDLSIDDSTLSIVNGSLSVKSIVSVGSTGDVQFDSPLYITAPAVSGDPSVVNLSVDNHTISVNQSGELAASILQGVNPIKVDDSSLQVSLLFDKTLEVDTNTNELKVASGLLEGWGAISIIEDPLEWAPLDLGFNPSLGVVKVNTDGITITQLGDVLQANYRAMSPLSILENEISLQVDDVTLVAGATLAANYKGMPPVVIQANEISLQLETTPGLIYDAGVLSLGLTSTNPGLLVDNEVGSLTLDLIGGNGVLVEENVISLDVIPGEGLVEFGNVWSAPIVGGEGIMVVWVPELGYEISALTLATKKPKTDDDEVETEDPAPTENTLQISQGGYKGTNTSGSVTTTGGMDAVASTITPDLIGMTLPVASTIIPVDTVLGGILSMSTASGTPTTTTVWGNNPTHSTPQLDSNGNIVTDPTTGQPLPQLDPVTNMPIPIGNNAVAISIDSQGNAYAFTDTPQGFDPLSWINGTAGFGTSIIPNLGMVSQTITQVTGQEISPIQSQVSSIQDTVNNLPNVYQPTLTNTSDVSVNTITTQGGIITPQLTITGQPVNDTDATTKSYVDTSVQNVQSQVDTATSNVTNLQNEQTTLQNQVDTLQTEQSNLQPKIDASTPLTTGVITAPSITITNQPVNGEDATNKTYVDGEISTIQSQVNTIQGKQSVDETNIQSNTNAINALPSTIYTNLKSDLVAGTNIDITSNDTNNQITLGVTGVIPLGNLPTIPYSQTSGVQGLNANLTSLSAVSPSIGSLSIGSNPVATQSFVTSTYQPLITAGTGLLKSGNTLYVDTGTILSVSGAASTYTPKFTVSTPLVYSNNALSLNSAAITSLGTLTGLTSSGVVNISNTTASTSTTTGALLVTGGAGFQGSVYASNLFIGTNPVATQSFVTNQGYLTSSSASPTLSNVLTVPGIQPATTGSGNLGTSALRYNNLYVNYINGTTLFAGQLNPTSSGGATLGASNARWGLYYGQGINLDNASASQTSPLLFIAPTSVISATIGAASACVFNIGPTIGAYYQISTTDTASNSLFPVRITCPRVIRPLGAGQVTYAASVYIAGAPIAADTNTTFGNNYGILIDPNGAAGAGNPGSAYGMLAPGYVCSKAGMFPNATNSFDIGNSTYGWRNLYTQNINFSGSITGDLYSAIKNYFVGGTSMTVALDDTNKKITLNAAVLTAASPLSISNQTISIDSTQITSVGTLSSMLKVNSNIWSQVTTDTNSGCFASYADVSVVLGVTGLAYTNHGSIQVYSGGSFASVGTNPYTLEIQPKGGNVILCAGGGITTVSGTADSTSPTTGAIQTAGGAGIQKSVCIGGSLYFGDGNAYIRRDTTAQTVTLVNAGGSGGSGGFYFSSFNSTVFQVANTGIFPVPDNSRYCGGNGARWYQVWSANGVIQTSDENEKEDVEEIEDCTSFVKSLRPVKYRWKRGRDTNKVHWGFTSQNVAQVAKEQLKGSFGGVHFDEKTKQPVGLVYSQLLAPMMKCMQQMLDRLDALESMVAQG